MLDMTTVWILRVKYDTFSTTKQLKQYVKIYLTFFHQECNTRQTDVYYSY